ncbi:MAG: M15 family metallopeptidase [Shewanella sp.]|nr:M15 family metallopeptidase [Shewanella sp.]MCF1431884.1 M15 family metallopeptidase [Shewanella sp.]MCF1438163.1 M15 family metallopeptidase [Shewanella sp.]MCF1458857.1 M15 family metallopeptidase [Shewanella sp.]
MKKLLLISLIMVFSTTAFGNIDNGQLFDDKCAPEDRLKTITLNYVNFNNEDSIGNIKVLDTLVPYITNVFDELYQARFPIYSMNAGLVKPQKSGLATSFISYYKAEDVDNTAAYACRPITAGSIPSIHAYGAAIDLNPRENPYIGFNDADQYGNRTVKEIIPVDGWNYITRSKYREGKPIHKGINNTLTDIFKKNGILRWGGDWNYPIDYMHFEVYRDVDILLLTMSSEEASEYFESYVDFYSVCKSKYPVEYSQRNFNDLSKAIAIIKKLSPIDIYLNSGFRNLMASAQDALATPDKDICLSKALRNKAYITIDVTRNISL